MCLPLLTSASRSKFSGCLLGLGCLPMSGCLLLTPLPLQAAPLLQQLCPAATRSLWDVTDTCSGQGSKLNLHLRCLHHMKAGFNTILTKHKYLCNKYKIHFILNEPFQEDKNCTLSNPSVYFCSGWYCNRKQGCAVYFNLLDLQQPASDLTFTSVVEITTCC